MQHVKEQNWFAVGLDVIVVIVGIFLGMQVTEWNDDRKNKALENEYISRIISDLDESIQENEEVLQESDTQVRELKLAVELLYEKTLDDSNYQKFMKSLAQHSTGWDSIIIIDDTIEELQSTGFMGLIRSTEVRKSINRFQRKYAEYLDTQESVKDFMVELHLRWFDIISLTPNFLVTTPIEEFKNNREYYNLLNRMLAIHRVINSTSKELDEETKKFKEVLIVYLSSEN